MIELRIKHPGTGLLIYLPFHLSILLCKEKNQQKIPKSKDYIRGKIAPVSGTQMWDELKKNKVTLSSVKKKPKAMKIQYYSADSSNSMSAKENLIKIKKLHI